MHDLLTTALLGALRLSVRAFPLVLRRGVAYTYSSCISLEFQSDRHMGEASRSVIGNCRRGGVVVDRMAKTSCS